jgi:putative membrane protein
LILAPADEQALAARTREIEQRTGAQVVVAVLGRARAYPEATWRAFAAGAALGAAAAVAAGLLRPDWPAATDALRAALLALAAGVAAALAARLSPALARGLLARHAREAAVRERARSLFVEHGVHGTRDRIGVLALVSLLERRVELVPDVGLDARLPAAAWDEVIAAMRPALTSRRTAQAFAAGLEALERALTAAGLAPAPGGGNELPREVVVAEGGDR